jgi:RHS repeat-associated protein
LIESIFWEEKMNKNLWMICLLGVMVGCGGTNGDGSGSSSTVYTFEECENGVDDNDDGDIDCADSNCQLEEACVFIPPDPSAHAPTLDPTELSNFHDSIRFLYEGDQPIIRGVDPNAVDPSRVTVLRGKILDTDGEPLSGVRARIAGKSSLGYTYSRDDGMIDLVANAGSPITVRYDTATHLPVDRKVDPEPLSFEVAEEVVLTPVDDKVTRIDPSKSGQIAAGSPIADSDGARQMRVYFEPGTVAEVLLPDGTTAELDDFDVRATEYTVGERGQARMPATLPDDSAYTYAVELSLDIAREIGTHEVKFDEPVRLYLENFLDFDVGTVVPSGFYNRRSMGWEPNPNGRVIQRVGQGIDIDGDGAVDDQTALEMIGVTPDELSVLREQFDDGEVIWRSPVTHFSPHDLNWPFEFPENAIPPEWIPDFADSSEPDPCAEAGSIIECQNQVLGERVDIPGTGASLWYRSDRVEGRGRNLSVEVTGDQIPDSISRITVAVSVAGQRHVQEFEPATNLTYDWEWDGLDGFGREVHGSAPVLVTINYFYPIEYTVPQSAGPAFGVAGGQPVGGARRAAPITKKYRGKMGSLDIQSTAGLGGWMIDLQPFYDADEQIFFPASAPEQTSRDISRLVRNLETFGGDAASTLGFDPRSDDVINAEWLEQGPDGALYIALRQGSGSHFIVRRDPDGTLEHVGGKTVPGNPHPCLVDQPCQLTGPAHDVIITAFMGAVADDGSLYYSNGQCIFRMVDGEVSSVGGMSCNDATDAGSDSPYLSIEDIAVGPGNTLYLADHDEIYQMDPSTGDATLYAGGGSSDAGPGDGGPATEVDLRRPRDMDVGSDGTLYFVGNTDSIRTVTPAGVIDTLYVTEDEIHFLSISPSDEIYFAGNDGRSTHIKQLVGTEAVSFAGAAFDELPPGDAEAYKHANDAHNIPATSALLKVFGLAADASGTVYYASFWHAPDDQDSEDPYPIIKEIRSATPQASESGEVLLASASGDRLRRFAASGRLLETYSAKSGASLYTYEYDDHGYLIAIDAASEQRTQIERASDGSPAAIIGPFGHRTEFELDANGYISVIRTPDGAESHFSYSDAGLLEEATDPNGDVSSYEYDIMGRLLRAEDAAGGWKTLINTGSGVRLETAEGRVVDYDFDLVSNSGFFGSTTVMTDAAGLEWRTTQTRLEGTTLVRPDGSELHTQEGVDPRFGLQVKYVADRSTQLPSGLTQTMERTRQATMSDSADLLSLASMTETTDINGRTWVTTYDASSRTSTRTSPEGREYITTFDALDRVVSQEVPGYAPVEIERDAMGRVETVHHGDRTISATFGDDGLVETLTDGMGASVALVRDPVGRVVEVTDPAGQQRSFGFDAKGQMVSVGAADASYTQEFTPYGQLASRTSPSGDTRQWNWDLDRRLAAMSLPTGESIGYEYDAAARLVREVTPHGDYTWTFDSDTGLLDELSSPDVTTTLDHDSFLITQTTHSFLGASATVTRQFNDDFWVTRRTVSGTDAIEREFDRDGLLTRAGPIDLTYESASPGLSTTAVGQVVSDRSHNTFGGLHNEQFTADGQTLFDYTLEYDDIGRVVGKTEIIDGVTSESTYARDQASRITEVKVDGTTVETYAYDGRENLLEVNGRVASYADDDTVESVGGRTYTFDEAGFLDDWEQSGQTTQFRFDARGQLREAVLGGDAIAYKYDSLGRRVARTVNGSLDRGWVYDDSNHPVARLDANGDVMERYIYATRQYVPDLIVRGSETYRLITDHVGSVRMVVDVSDGTIVQRLDYEVFGRITSDTNPGFQPFGFAGGIHDPTTGLVRFGQRDYDPFSAAWTSPDPRGFGGGSINLYAYAHNDPVQFVDPNGKIPLIIPVIIVLAAGGTYYAKTVKDTAYDSADATHKELRGFGADKGPQDALRHCTMNCRMKRSHGQSVAELASWYHEVPEPWIGGNFDNTPQNPARQMDEHNNMCGRWLAESQDPATPCISHCRQALRTGQLEMMPESAWGHWESSNPERGRTIWESWRRF